LELPEKIGGSLNLNGLTSANGLKLPEEIGGYLHLNGLTNARGLKLPEKIGGKILLPRKLQTDQNLVAQIAAKGLQGKVEWQQ
jgi:hypothetical protein